MNTTLIKIKNLFGISETTLDGSSVEITGTNGAGKTSVLDAIRYALTNDSSRAYIIKEGAEKGEIYIETDNGLRISREKRTNKSDYKSVKENGKEVGAPESFLKTLFTPLQLDPVAFTKMSRQEQNRAILDLIDFDWDMKWISEQFGEIPQGVDYSQNILQVLSDIQSESGVYFQTRQDTNREIRTKKNMILEIAKDIPAGYDYDRWNTYPVGEKYRELERIRENNNVIARAKAFKDSYDAKKRGLDGDKAVKIAAIEREINAEKDSLNSTIERLKAEIKAAEDKLSGLAERQADKINAAESQYNEAVAKLEKDVGVASEYSGKEPIDITPLSDEINEAEAMRKHLNEYQRMKAMQYDVDSLTIGSEELTRKIELARELPGEILKTGKIPVDGLTVENGVPLIHGLPISNLSEGEQLDLCVDVALSNPLAIKLILIDGAEKLSDENRERLYKKCKDNGLQFIATRTTNDTEMVVTSL